MFNVVDYRAPDASADWAPAIQAAVNAAGAYGGQVYFPRGRYLVNSTVTYEGNNSISLYGPGATLVQGADLPVLNLRGGWEWITNVSSIARRVSVDLTDGSQGPTVVSQVTVALAQAQTLRRGDVVKIVDEGEYSEIQAANPTGARKRRGEFAVVAKDPSGPSDDTVTLSGVLRDDYTIDPRLAKLRNTSFSLEGLSFDTVDAGSTAWSREMLVLSSARDVSIRDVHILRAWGKGMELRGLYGYSVWGGSYANLRNDSLLNRWGYGIADTACEGGSVSGVRFRNCRHGITTTDIAVSMGAAMEYYGKSAYTSVDNCHGGGNSNAPFDTHPLATDWSFADCTSVASFRGKDALGSGFQVRGERIQLVNCRSTNDQAAFVIVASDVLLDSCHAYGATGYAITAPGLAPTVRNQRVVVRGGVFESTGAVAVTLKNTDIHFEDVTIRFPGTGSGSSLFSLRDSTVTFRNLTLDMSGFTGTQGAAFYLGSGNCSVKGSGLHFIKGSRQVNGLVRYNTTVDTNNPENNLDSAVVEVEDVVMDSSVSAVASAAPYPYRIARREVGSTANNSGILARTLTGASTDLDDVGRSPDPVIQLSLAAGGADRTLGALPDGFRPGQLLVIRSSGSGAYTITIPSGTTFNTDLGENVALSNGQAVVLAWGDGVWVRMQKTAGRQWIQGWHAGGISAGTNVVMSRAVSDAMTPNGWRAPRAGSITAIALDVSAQVTAGRLDGVLFRNGASMSDGMFFTSATGGTHATKTFAFGALAFAAGDVITLRAIADGSFAPGANAMVASIQVELP